MPIPGLGASSPVILGDRIYLTSAVETDREGPDFTSRRGITAVIKAGR